MIKYFLTTLKHNEMLSGDSVGTAKPENPKKKEISVNEIPAGILAYMGDVVYEMIVRNFFIQRKLFGTHQIHRTVIKFVNAGAQAALLRMLEEHLTEDEKVVMRRARNSNAGNVPRNAKVSDYRYSTAFEAVLGYLVLKEDFDRLMELIHLIEKYLEDQVSGKSFS